MTVDEFKRKREQARQEYKNIIAQKNAQEEAHRRKVKAAATDFLNMALHKPNDHMMMNASSNYAKKQLEDTESKYEKFLASNQDSNTAPVNLPEAVKLQEKAKTLSSEVDYWENKKTAYKNQAVMQKDMEEYERWPEEDKQLLRRYVANRSIGVVGGQAVGFLGSLALDDLNKKYGKDTVAQIAESYSRHQNQQAAQKATELGEKSATGFWGKTGSSVLSVGANLLGNATGMMDTANEFMSDAAFGTGRYSGLDPNLAGNLPAKYSGTVRGKVSEELEEKGGWGKAASVAYQGAMSAADSLARLAVAGESGSLALGAMGTFGQTVSDVSARGGNKYQAIGLGVINAGLEVATEKVSLDRLLSQSAAGPQTATQILNNIFVQAGVEVSEEELSFIGSTLAEAAVMRDKSTYNQQISELVASGKSYQEAKEQADRALINEALQTAFVSAVSGGLMSGGASVVNKLSGNATQTVAETQTAQNVVPDSAEVNPETAPQAPQPEETEAEMKRRTTIEAIREVVGGKAQSAGETVGTNAVSNPISSYPTEKQSMIRSYIQAVDESIKSFVRRVKGGDKTFRRQKIADVTERAATDIGRILGIDVSGYTHNINTGGIQHIINRHGENGVHDNSMAMDEDIARVGWVLENYDSVELLTEDGQPVYSGEFKDSANNPAPQIRFVKKIDGSYYVVEAACENKYKKLWVQSAYLQKNNGDVTQVSVVDQSADTRTNVRNELASPSPDTSIYRQQENVNRSGANPESSVGAAERGFTGTAAYDELLYDGNIQRTRKGDARNIEVPITDASGNMVSEFVGNSMNSEMTSDRFTDTIKKLVTDEQLSHEVQTNEETLCRAAQSIEEDGEIYDSVQKVKEVAKSGKTSPNDIAKALLLYQYLTDQVEQQIQEKGDADGHTQSLQSDAYVSLAQLATNTGRSMQLFSLFRKMTPEYQVKVLQKEVNREIEKLQKQGVVKKNYRAQISSEMLQEYRNAAEENRKAKSDGEKAETEQKMKEIQDAIYMSEAAKLPATFKAKWDAWRYMAMLGNVKTQARNIMGNVSFAPYVAVKNTVGTLAEMALIRDKKKRTKAFVGLSKSDRALWSWAIADTKSESTQSILKGTAKLGDNMNKGTLADNILADNMRIFKSGALEGTRNLVNKVTEGGDMLFKNPYYASSLAGFIKARGYTAADIQSGKVPDSVLNDARIYAANEAMKATFNDSNAFSDFMSNFGRKNTDNWFGKAANIALEGVIPFRKTPANIVVRFSDYTVGGLVKGVWNAAKCINDGGASAATAIDSLVSGMTGTGMAVLGYFMASGMFGFRITGSGVDEDEERQGHQKYAVEFSIDGQDYSYSIDWVAPANLPLFVGANLYEAWKKADENPTLSKFTSTIYGMATSFEPLMELSCMSSLNDIFQAGKYADNDALYAAAAQAATSYLTQGIPALVRQTAQATQEHKQQTFANSSDPLIRDLQRKAGNIPFVGAALQMDKVDAWGKPESRGNVAERIFNAYFNPGTLKQIDNGAVEREITRLNESQEESVSPPDISKTISYTDSQGKYHKDHRLTEDEYDALARTQGQTAKRILDDLVGKKDYEALSDSQKAEVFGLVYDYAREKSRTEVIEGYPGMKDSWMQGNEGKEGAAIIRKVAESQISGAFDSLVKDWKAGGDGGKAGEALDAAYRIFQSLGDDTQEAIRENASGRVEDFFAAMDAGVEPETFTELYRSYYGINAQDDIKPTEKANQWAYKLQRANERGEITGAQMETLKNTMTFSSARTVETKKYDELVEAGFSADKAYYVVDLLTGIEGTGSYNEETGKNDIRTIDQIEAIAKADALPESDRVLAMQACMTDGQIAKMDSITDRFGLSAEAYAELYRAYLPTDTKAEEIAAYEALGYSHKVAESIYYMYHPKK